MSEPWFPDRNASRAVLIGASEFLSSDLPDLPAVAHNLDALGQVLTDPRHGVIGGCTVLADHDVTDAKVGVAVAEAAGEATSLLLVYHAGHGVLDDDGRLHLARPDTSMDYIGWTSVSVELLKRDLGRARARARVLVLDCCFSGRAVAAMADSRSLVAGQLDLSGTYTLTSTTATAPSHAPPGKRYTSFTKRPTRRAGATRPAHPGQYLPPDRRRTRRTRLAPASTQRHQQRIDPRFGPRPRPSGHQTAGTEGATAHAATDHSERVHCPISAIIRISGNNGDRLGCRCHRIRVRCCRLDQPLTVRSQHRLRSCCVSLAAVWDVSLRYCERET